MNSELILAIGTVVTNIITAILTHRRAKRKHNREINALKNSYGKDTEQ